ncbi:MAG: hypothetical protein IPI46_02990 [Bacteroidetes bacterium]|nr:hypothetical protein [Bacteroidota bacterium]
MRFLSISTLLCLLILSSACKKKKVERTYYRNYNLNSAYTGSHPSSNVTASIYMIEKSGYLQFQIHMTGMVDSLQYKLHFHEQDITEPYGYTGNPVIDFGLLSNQQSIISKELSSIDFDAFTKDFKGYFIVHDPNNIQNDTTTLLIYGKVGADW